MHLQGSRSLFWGHQQHWHAADHRTGTVSGEDIDGPHVRSVCAQHQSVGKVLSERQCAPRVLPWSASDPPFRRKLARFPAPQDLRLIDSKSHRESSSFDHLERRAWSVPPRLHGSATEISVLRAWQELASVLSRLQDGQDRALASQAVDFVRRMPSVACRDTLLRKLELSFSQASVERTALPHNGRFPLVPARRQDRSRARSHCAHSESLIGRYARPTRGSVQPAGERSWRLGWSVGGVVNIYVDHLCRFRTSGRYRGRHTTVPEATFVARGLSFSGPLSGEAICPYRPHAHRAAG